MSEAIFDIFSWEKPFLPGLKNFLLELCNGEPGRAVIITPNRRPGRYIHHLLAQDKKAGILPRIIAINDLVSLWRSENTDAPMRVANTLDQAALLYECVQDAATENSLLAKHFGAMNMGDFLPWAIRLAQVLEDFNIAGRPLDDIPNLEGEVSEAAASLLASLRLLGEAFNKRLHARNWTTNGYDHLLAARNAGKIPSRIKPAPDRPVLIAGFYMPDHTHELLLKQLWQEGARLCLHTDPALAEGEAVHPAALDHQNWLHRWHARARLYGAPVEQASKADCHFFSGYDLHSQLDRVNEIIGAEPEKTTAIILGKPDALMATLQNLPPVNVNVSLGYPMERSSLAQLLENLLALGENRKDSASWRSDKVLKVLRHPFLAMAKTEFDGVQTALAPSLRQLDYLIRKTGRYWRPDAPVKAEAEAARREMKYLLELFAAPATLADLGRALQNLVDWLIKYAGKPWAARYPLDAEALYRLENEIIPALVNNLLAHEIFPLQALRDIFQNLVRQQRIPFEANPIEGVQVLGLLESRLLHFDRLIFMDATDDVLPGTSGIDPLLPDSLRYLLNLPDNSRREALAAHNIQRLLAGAEEAHFIWQEGSGNAGEGKKIRSRFMEKLIWEQEKKDPSLIREQRSVVAHPMTRLKTRLKVGRPVVNSPAVSSAINAFWQQPVSPTALDAYLACPASFIRSHVLALSENAREGDNPSLVAGNLVHNILKDVYGPPLHEEIRGENDRVDFIERVQSSFKDIVKRDGIEEKIPLESFLALLATVPLHLGEYRQKQPDKTFIVALETEMAADLPINGKKIHFTGKFDRLDRRDGMLYLTDYKTGRPQNINPSFWDNGDFFTKARKACDANDFTAIDDLFNEMRENVKSVQLPLYTLLLAESGFVTEHGAPANAALVYLAGSGEEEKIFSSDLSGPDDRRLAHCLNAIELIEAHMRLAPEFAPDDEASCKWCGCSALCRN